MHESLSESDYRLRLQRVGNVLRALGVTDPGGIADLLQRANLPSQEVLAAKVRSLDLRLPPTISAEFVASAIHSQLQMVSPATAAWEDAFGKVGLRLSTIPVGRRDAASYHDHISELLQAIFDGVLVNPRKEQDLQAKIRRVDIMFDNEAEKGFFRDLGSRHRLKADYIPFECKNYSGDLGTPEYDQLSGRLDAMTSQVGFLVMREVTNWERAREHCQSKLRKKEFVILLDDSDISAMFSLRKNGNIRGLDRLLADKLRSLKLNVAR